MYDRVSSTPLIQAIFSSSVLYVKFLLQTSADLYYINKFNWSALHFAAEYNDNRETLQYLIIAGVDLEGRDSWDLTLVAIAASNNNIQLAK